MNLPRLASLLSISVGLTATSGHAQFSQYAPLIRTMDMLVVDSSFDGIWRKSDLNQDGDVNDANEIIAFYDDVNGSIQLTNPNCIAIGPDSTVFIGDSTIDVIVRLRDNDGNGDALGAGEHQVFFDSATNADGITMASVQDVTVSATGVVWCAVSNAGSSGQDMILQLTDVNLDGDANDAGEAKVYCLIPNASSSVGDSIPTEVDIGPDGLIYYADVGASGVITKGVYRLTDLNNDGDCNDPGEVNLFWSPNTGGNSFFWGLAISRVGEFYITDHGTETVWRAIDLNNDGTIQQSEETLFYATSASTYWDVILRSDGAVVLCEDQSPDRLVELIDRNFDGDAQDSGESQNIYDDTVSSVDTRPRGATFLPAPQLAISPSSVGIGQTATISVLAPKAGEVVGLAVSDRISTPIPLPPIGNLEINPAFTQLVISGTANAQGIYALPITVPNNPALRGVSLAFQAISGDSYRSYLSNPTSVRIQ